MAGTLILSRKENERIMIGDNIVITLVEIRGDKARIGVTCPREIPVHREEVWLRIKQDESNASEPL